MFDFFFRQNGKRTATFATLPPLKKALLIVAVSAQGFITLIVLLSEGIFQGMGQLKLWRLQIQKSAGVAVIA